MFELTLCCAIFISLCAYWRWRQVRHEQRLVRYGVRIHVNGTRGKSTVTRLIAGVMREAGMATIGKTTGSAAVVIGLDGQDLPIERLGAPNVWEQADIIAGWDALGATAMVVECMAVEPRNLEWSERKVLHSHIGVITNVRGDHQDVMGETLPEIARSLARMTPRNGVLITAEAVPDLQDELRRAAADRGSRVIAADPSAVTDADVARFDYLTFKDNVAIGLAVAELLGIDRDTAMRGMVRACPDVGVLRLRTVRLHDRPVMWANLFAVNDCESLLLTMERLAPYGDAQTVKIGILNNRLDREWRAQHFSDFVTRHLAFDWLITCGAYEELVTRTLVRNGFLRDRIVNFGFSENPVIDEMIEAIAGMIPPGGRGFLAGLVNLHTPQADQLVAYFDGLDASDGSTYLPDMAEPGADHGRRAERPALVAASGAPIAAFQRVEAGRGRTVDKRRSPAVDKA